MRKAIGMFTAVLLLAGIPGLAFAGPNPDAKLAMHVVATADYLYCTELQALLTNPTDIDPDVSEAELAASYGYFYVCFVAYDVTEMSGVEFKLAGWPTGRGAPPLPTMNWCPESSLVLGDPWVDGAITAYGECNTADPQVAAWFVNGSTGLTFPMPLSYVPSSYSYAADPHNYTLGCAPDFVEDNVVREYGCVVGGAVAPAAEIVSPNGGEVLTGGATYDIEWYSFGFDEAFLAYTTDGGGNWTLINAVATTTLNYTLNSYTWTVPEVNSTDCYVRVSGMGIPPLDMSDAAFEITTTGGEQTITLTAPNNGEALSVGSQTTIQWTSENITDVKIEYGNPDEPRGWTTIIASTPSGPTGGSYLWTIPDDPGKHLMRVSDAADGDPVDLSDQQFGIFEILTISAPTTPVSWQVGTQHTISWVHAGIQQVNIEYGFVTWTPIATNLPATPGSYNWTIPNDPGPWLIRVSDAEDGDPAPTSAVVTIFAPSVTVTYPNGGESFAVGAQPNITWSWVGVFPSVSVDYSVDGGANWIAIATSTPNDGSFTWTVPDNVSNNCKVRICAIGTGVPAGTCDESNLPFTIFQTVQVTQPNGGEEWPAGSTQDITWNSEGITNVSIDYGFDDPSKGWTNITPSTPSGPAGGSYSWQLPGEPGTYKIRVCDANDGSPCDQSDAFFDIVQSVVVTEPSVYDEWVVGSTHDIAWTALGIENVSIEYGYPDDGKGWTIIEASVPFDSSPYSWLIPDDPGFWWIRVCDASDGSPCGISPTKIQIIETIEVVEPTGGDDHWLVGTTQTIEWTSVGIQDVMIEYQGLEKKVWTTIVASTPAGPGTYDWLIPDDVGWFELRVCDAEDGTPCGYSDEFEIYQGLDLTSPEEEDWQVDSVHDVTWESAGIQTVNIYYGYFWKDDFVKEDGGIIVEGYDATAGTYAWTIPNDPGCFDVLIEDANDGNPWDLGYVCITMPTVTLTRPNGGEVFVVGTSEDITWTGTGDFDYVSLEYTTDWDKSVGWQEITPSTENDGLYEWTVPNDPSDWCVVRVCIVDPPGGDPICDLSDATFEIRLQEALDVTAPENGESYVVGDPIEITWNATEVETVTIYYGDDTKGWTYITTRVTSGTGSFFYDWIAPDDPGDWFIKICDSNDNDPCDIGENTFNIHETIEVTYPTGGERFEVGTQVMITWNSAGIDSIRIYYGQPGSWSVIAYPVGADLGQYLWTVPNDPGFHKIFVFDTEDGVPGDMSDDFEIYVPGLTVTYPNGGEAFEVGEMVEITWTSSDVYAVNIEFGWPNGEKQWNTITTYAPSGPTGGSYMWEVPDAPGDWYMKVCNVEEVKYDVCDLSDDTFNIYESLDLTYPVGGERFEVGSQVTITWETAGVDDIRIYYGQPGLWVVIDYPVPTDPPQYVWTVPNDAGFHKVRIFDAEDGVPASQSEDFEIYVPGITVTYPNGGESFEVGEMVQITWTSSDVEFVDISYGLPDGKSWTPIAFEVASSPTGGSYMWEVPDDPGDWFMRVCSSGDLRIQVCDLSDDTFNIHETLELTFPVGGEVFNVGENVMITWNAVGIDSIRIYYGQPGMWNVIAYPVAAGPGQYPWPIPNDPGFHKVFIFDTEDGTPGDMSDDFEIVFPVADISGCVDYMHNGNPVPGVEVYLGYDKGWMEITGPDGCYKFMDIPAGYDYCLWPYKFNDVPLFTVMAWDAAICSRIAGGLPIPLPPGHFPPTRAESLSADLDRNGVIDMVDAASIANKAAGLPWPVPPGPAKPVPPEWIFEPPDRCLYLEDDISEQDFSAVLLGDVDGNWGPIFKGSESLDGIRATYNPLENSVEVFIRVRNVPGVVSMDCAVSYDPRVLRPISVIPGYAFDTFQTVSNPDIVVGKGGEMGLVYTCAYRPDPVTVTGVGPDIIFEVLNIDEMRNGVMNLEGFYLNDQLVGYGPLAYIGLWEVPGFVLGPILPNPFNPETSISFTLPDGDPARTTLKIYNAQGQLVKTLLDEVMIPGQHTVQWNGTNQAGAEVATGVFFCILESGDLRDSKKMLLLK